MDRNHFTGLHRYFSADRRWREHWVNPTDETERDEQEFKEIAEKNSFSKYRFIYLVIKVERLLLKSSFERNKRNTRASSDSKELFGQQMFSFQQSRQNRDSG